VLQHLLCYCCTHRTGHNYTEIWISSCSLPVHIDCSWCDVELCKYRAISLSIRGGSNRLDNTNCSKQCADRTGITETGPRQLSVGTYWVRPNGTLRCKLHRLCLWIKTIWQGKPLNQWKLGALKSPIKEHCDFGIKVLLEYTKMFRNYVGGRQWLAIHKLRPLWVEILTQTIRHKTADHSCVYRCQLQTKRLLEQQH